jgi:hypothetical protein
VRPDSFPSAEWIHDADIRRDDRRNGMTIRGGGVTASHAGVIGDRAAPHSDELRIFHSPGARVVAAAAENSCAVLRK